ncbi:MAG: hypothetical protein GY701_16895 [Sulfitobacter sp.]|nr:hypothetical protein [Sulfitobacter sp.]
MVRVTELVLWGLGVVGLVGCVVAALIPGVVGLCVAGLVRQRYSQAGGSLAPSLVRVAMVVVPAGLVSLVLAIALMAGLSEEPKSAMDTYWGMYVAVGFVVAGTWDVWLWRQRHRVLSLPGRAATGVVMASYLVGVPVVWQIVSRAGGRLVTMPATSFADVTWTRVVNAGAVTIGAASLLVICAAVGTGWRDRLVAASGLLASFGVALIGVLRVDVAQLPPLVDGSLEGTISWEPCPDGTVSSPEHLGGVYMLDVANAARDVRLWTAVEGRLEPPFDGSSVRVFGEYANTLPGCGETTPVSVLSVAQLRPQQ